LTIELIRPSDLSDAESDILNGLVKQLADKAPRNLMRSNAYDGKRAVSTVGSVIPPQYKNLALVLGWVGKGVDGLANRCNIDRFVWNGGDLESLGLQELIDDNFLMSELSQARTDSLVNGVSYLVTTQGLPGEPKTLIHARDALNATGDWNVRKRELDSFLSVTSRGDNDAVTGFVLYLPGETISGEKVDGVWSIERSEHHFRVPVDPMVHQPRAGRRMGRSRITRPALSHQDSAVRALLRTEAHMDIYAIAKMVILGGSDSMFKDENGNYKASWQVAMGRVFGVPDDEDADPANARADVKQFAAESPQPHLAQLNALAKLSAREFDLPDQDFALTDMANPTSEGSYVQGRDSLVAKAEVAMEDWSVSIRRTLSRALAMRNGETSIPASYSGIVPDWRSPLYLSKAAQADAGQKQLAAVPWLADTRVGLQLIGLDEQQIKEALAEKQRTAGRALVAALAQRAGQPQNALPVPAPADVVGA
jgi:hypothetical protein